MVPLARAPLSTRDSKRKVITTSIALESTCVRSDDRDTPEHSRHGFEILPAAGAHDDTLVQPSINNDEP